MNRQIAQVLQLGIIFTVIVVFLDVLLGQLPILVWLGLGVTFFFVAVAILDLVASLVSKEKPRLDSKHEKYDELQYLSEVVDRAANRNEHESLEVLSEKLRSIALGAVAVRTKLSKEEILELANDNPSFLLAVVKDEQIAKALGRNAVLEVANRDQIESLLSKIEVWSR